MIKHTALAIMAAVALQGLAQAQSIATTPIIRDASVHYIVTRADLRKCAYPFCGGYFVKAVNQRLTRCADGSLKKECHAVSLNTDALGWSGEQRAAFNEQFGAGKALVRGHLALGEISSIKTPVLTAKEAWQGQALSKPTGAFYAVKSTGIVCITTPCPSIAVTLLNSASKPTNPDLDLSTSGASDKAIEAAGQALSTTGILAAGTLVPTKSVDFAGRTRRGTQLATSEFYLPATP